MLLALLLAFAAEEDPIEKAMREAQATFGGDKPIQQVKSTTDVNGYVMDRVTHSWVDIGALTTSPQLPQIQNIIEANVQLRRPLWKGAFAAADASLFMQQGGWFVAPNGVREIVAGTDNPSLYPIFVPSELYVSYSPHDNFNILIGRRRIVWGPGMANNPTDIINPPRDPSDPNLQRAGGYVLRIEVPTERFTVSALASPAVVYAYDGIPYQFLNYPAYAHGDAQLHYLLAARLYALLFDSDINVIYYFSNLYNDSYRNKSRVGLTFSRYFFTDWEVHIEALLSWWSTQRIYANPDCVGDLPTLGRCFALGTALTQKNLVNDTHHFYPRIVAGTRRSFSDESTLSIEYMFVGDGYTPGEFQTFVSALALAKQTGQSATSLLASQTPNANGLVARFNFDPLRRHYVFVSYTKPKIANDWTVGGVLLSDLEDLSTIVVPSVTWNALEWLNLQLGAFVPITQIPVGQAHAFGKAYSEYSMFPYDYRVYFEARAFY